MAEGIAQTAPPLVLDGAYEELADRLAPLGFDYDGETGARFAAADQLLTPREYTAQWSLQPADRVEKFFASQVEDRPSRGYVHCYSHGQRLCTAYVDGDPARLRRLMTARVVPADLDT